MAGYLSGMLFPPTGPHQTKKPNGFSLSDIGHSYYFVFPQ